MLGSSAGAPAAGRRKVVADVEKIGLRLAAGACRVGYVVVFEDADSGFAQSFAENASTDHHGCRVRFIRSAAVIPLSNRSSYAIPEAVKRRQIA